MTIEGQPGYAKGRSTRQSLLEEATALFGEVGYRSASLRDIAARCGISHPGVLYHFPTKEALLRAVLEHRDHVDAQRVSITAAHGVEALQRIVEVVAHNLEVPGLVELYATLSAEATTPDHPARDFFVRRYARFREALVKTFAEIEGQGRLAPGLLPEELAVQTIALLDGLQVQWLLDRASVDMASSLRRFLATVIVDWP